MADVGLDSNVHMILVSNQCHNSCGSFRHRVCIQDKNWKGASSRWPFMSSYPNSDISVSLTERDVEKSISFVFQSL